MFERKSIKWPIILAVTMIVLLVGLMIAWVLLNVFNALSSETSAGVYWVLLSIGSAMFTCVVVGVVMYLVLSIQQININRRQSNFIDSVTHELKSPIASLKLYLQTLGRRTVTDEQRHHFYRSMLEDVDRLDQLISQLLDVARLSHQAETAAMEVASIRVDEVIQRLVPKLCERHGVDPAIVKMTLQPISVKALVVDIELLFGNLIDNALKYAGSPPTVEISLRMSDDQAFAVGIISDNGPGIPRNMRRRVFGRFFRIGNELERTKPGTGLGLFLVKTVVRRLRGRIQIVDMPDGSGCQFEVRLPTDMAKIHVAP